MNIFTTSRLVASAVWHFTLSKPALDCKFRCFMPCIYEPGRWLSSFPLPLPFLHSKGPEGSQVFPLIPSLHYLLSFSHQGHSRSPLHLPPPALPPPITTTRSLRWRVMCCTPPPPNPHVHSASLFLLLLLLHSCPSLWTQKAAAFRTVKPPTWQEQWGRNHHPV